jgi:hypothetical protein
MPSLSQSNNHTRTVIKIALSMVLICVCALSCGTSTGTLQIEVQIVYNAGGPQPAARDTFFLFDIDPRKLPIPDVRSGDATSVALKITFPYRSADVDAVINPHVVQKAVTDFKGQATFENLKPGDYWLVGSTKTRRDDAYWLYKVSVKAGENKVQLSQDNAVYAQ